MPPFAHRDLLSRVDKGHAIAKEDARQSEFAALQFLIERGVGIAHRQIVEIGFVVVAFNIVDGLVGVDEFLIEDKGQG